MLKKLLDFKGYFIVNLLTSFTVFIFAPIEFFISNSDDFFFSIADVWSLSIIFFPLCFIFLCAIHLLLIYICRPVSPYILAVQTAITLALYIQGNFLRTDYGDLNGDSIDWSLYKIDAVISVLAWVIIIIAFVVICKKSGQKLFSKIISTLSVWILLVQIFAISVGLITADNLSAKVMTVGTTESQFDMAKEQNFIILLLDTFDSPTFYSVYSEDPEKYNNILDDFTYYKNTAGMYQFTSLSVPYIFSGNKFTENDSFNNYIETQYANSPFLHRLSDEGYRLGIYSLNFMPQSDLPYNIVNLSKMDITISSRKQLSIFLYRLLGYRYAPFHLKKYFWFYPDTDDFMDYKADDKEAYYDDDFIFYDGIDQLKKTDTEKAFFFYHLDGTHPPFDITDDFKRIDGETSIESETRGNLLMVDAFLKKLKSIDSYDNSVIVIMGDHGYTNLRQAPVLMVKGLNESKDFEISNIPVSFADYQEMFSSLLDGDDCSLLFDETQQKNKVREFFHYDFDKHGDIFFTEYSIPDDVFDATP